MVSYEAVKSDTPRPIKILKRGPYELECRIKAQHKLLFFALAVGTSLFILLLVGWFAMVALSDSIFVATLIIAGIIAGSIYWVRSKNFFHIHLRVTPDAVTINGKHYDPQIWDRFSSNFAGEITSNKGKSVTKFSDLDFIYGGNRHKTGHALPVNTGMLDANDDPNEVINWLNDAVSQVLGSNDAEPVSAASSGYRPQEF